MPTRLMYFLVFSSTSQSFNCCRFPIWELLSLAVHGFEQFWILERIAEDSILQVYSCGWGFTTRTCSSNTSAQSAHAATPTKADPSITSTSQICHSAVSTIVIKSICARSWMGDWLASTPRMQSPCTHLLDQAWSREWAYIVVCIKYDHFLHSRKG